MSATSGLVAQIFNLLYRRVELGRASDLLSTLESSDDPQIINLQTGRSRFTFYVLRFT